jgi:hypothetical protein
MCLDGEIISVRIALFGLVVENSVRLVKYKKSVNFYYSKLVKYYLDKNLRKIERIVNITNYFLVFYLIIIFYYYFHYLHEH